VIYSVSPDLIFSEGRVVIFMKIAKESGIL
jgi:hypothetical protein